MEGKAPIWSPRSQAQAAGAGLRAGVRLLIRDLRPWPGAQKALINQQHHRGEPVCMALWLGHRGPSLLKDILLPPVSQEWLQSWRQGCWLGGGVRQRSDALGTPCRHLLLEGPRHLTWLVSSLPLTGVSSSDSTVCPMEVRGNPKEARALGHSVSLWCVNSCDMCLRYIGICCVQVCVYICL